MVIELILAWYTTDEVEASPPVTILSTLSPDVASLKPQTRLLVWDSVAFDVVALLS
jgi:hypothetical protein